LFLNFAMAKKEIKILFISRAYPPIHGGIEDQNYSLGEILKRLTPTKIIANKKGKKNLPFFLFRLFWQLPFLLPKYDLILFGDGVLAPVGEFFQLFYKRQKFVSVIHGLDITYAQQKTFFGKLYRFFNIPALKNLDKLIMVGNHTIEEAVKAGIPRKKCVFIPNGVNIKKVYQPSSRQDLENLLAKKTGKDATYFQNKKILLRAGRFVPHKGLHWFIKEVMPLLPTNYILVGAGGHNPKAIGDKENYTLCQKYIREKNLADRVVLFPNIPQKEMNILFNTVDLYISPNIEIPGSMEGFGLNVLEAVVCERPVISADLQGLKDAIKNGVNGFLVKAEDVSAWKNKIEEVLSPTFDKQPFVKKAKEYTLDNFTWERIGEKYLDTLQQVVSAD